MLLGQSPGPLSARVTEHVAVPTKTSLNAKVRTPLEVMEGNVAKLAAEEGQDTVNVTVCRASLAAPAEIDVAKPTTLIRPLR